MKDVKTSQNAAHALLTAKESKSKFCLIKKEVVDEEHYSGRNKEIQASHKRAV